jgi:AmmeMemoRadiSam system protein B
MPSTVPFNAVDDTEVLKARLSGRLYTAEKSFLIKVLETYLRDAPQPVYNEPPKAILAPHSGFAFSGPCLGAAYAPWQNLTIQPKRVVILAPSHQYDFPGLALPVSTRFATPLGIIHVDTQATELIISHQFVRNFEAPFTEERSVELQLLFIQHLFPSAMVLPILAGRTGYSQVAQVVEELWDERNSLFVISSEMSSESPSGGSTALDAQTATQLENFAYTKITAAQACGFRLIKGFLKAASKRKMICRPITISTGPSLREPILDPVNCFGAFHFLEPSLPVQKFPHRVRRQT